MSNSAVLTRPLEEAPETGWIEMDELDGEVLVFEPPKEPDLGFIEMDSPVTVFESQDDMRFGPRTYTPGQAEIIQLAIPQRKPLPSDPLPSDE